VSIGSYQVVGGVGRVESEAAVGVTFDVHERGGEGSMGQPVDLHQCRGGRAGPGVGWSGEKEVESRGRDGFVERRRVAVEAEWGVGESVTGVWAVP
jgi:hypothetical protein